MLTEPRYCEKGVIIHQHLDEYFADFLGRSARSPLLIGFEAAPRIFKGHFEGKTPGWWASEHMVCLGGGGDFTDEHRNGAMERLRGASASKLMAHALGIKDPILLAMMEEVNWFDFNPQLPPSHLAAILKMAHTYRSGNDLAYYNWCKFILESIYKKMTLGLRPHRTELPFGDFVHQMVTEGMSSFEDETAREGLLKFIGEECDAADPLVFSARHAYKSLWRTAPGETKEDKMDHVGGPILNMISLLYQSQVHFHGFRKIARSEEFRENWFKIPVWNGEDIKWIDAAVAQTENPEAHRALRSLGAVVTVVKTSSGNATVFGNFKLAGQMHLLSQMDKGVQTLIAMNRFRDLPPGAEKSANWDVLMCRGNCPGDTKWYLPGDDNDTEHYWLSGYNGTRYHEAEPTSLTLKALRENAQAAFDPKGTDAWRMKYRVPRSLFKPVKSLKAWCKPVRLRLP